MIIFAVDPGNSQSAFVLYDRAIGVILEKGKVKNNILLEIAPRLAGQSGLFRIEMIASYGMPVGADVFETCVFIGELKMRVKMVAGIKADLIYRKQVKMGLCHSMKAKDSNIRQAIIDMFPPSGGGAKPQIGTKGKPGPLYGVSKDIWAALGVAVFDQGVA